MYHHTRYLYRTIVIGFLLFCCLHHVSQAASVQTQSQQFGTENKSSDKDASQEEDNNQSTHWDEVCYTDGDTDLGCFENEEHICIPPNSTIQQGGWGVAPQHPAAVATIFTLYSFDQAEGEIRTEVISYNDPPEKLASLVGPDDCIKAVIHGWTQSQSTWTAEAAERLVTCHPACKVIRVQWGGGSSSRLEQSNANIKLAGRQLGILLERLAAASGSDMCDFMGRTELIGHSMGAQMVGRTAYYLKTQRELEGRHCKVAMLVGLDAAPPYYENQKTGELASPVCRIDRTDADCVVIIHSGIRPAFLFDGQAAAGIAAPLGTYDLYPGEGWHHPWCEDLDADQDTGETTMEKNDQITCRHCFAYRLYLDTICQQECVYLAHQRNDSEDEANQREYDVTRMCHDATIPTGSYFFETGPKKPFCKISDSKENSNSTETKVL